jgi:hypothetical protein
MRDTISLPAALCDGLILEGLTAPSMRIALVLIAAATGGPGALDILKPVLEKQAGVRLDNAHRSLERIRDCTLSDGQRVFDEIVYHPGAQKRLAGIVRGLLSGPLLDAISDPRHGGRTVEIDLEELRGCGTVPGILLLLKLASPRQAAINEIRLRLVDRDCLDLFGGYLDRAGVDVVDADGTTSRSTSLSRIYADLITPAVRDLWSALDGYTIDAVPSVPVVKRRGRAWSHIDVVVTRLERRKSVRELMTAIGDHRRYKATKHGPAGSV